MDGIDCNFYFAAARGDMDFSFSAGTLKIILETVDEITFRVLRPETETGSRITADSGNPRGGAILAKKKNPVISGGARPEFLRINAVCNQRCRFCNVIARNGTEDCSHESVLNRLKELRKRSEGVIFTGGEPTINRDIFIFIRAAAEMRFETIGIETNGMMASYPEFAGRLLASGLTEARFTMLSHEKSVSDRISRVPGGWELTCGGIRALVNSNLSVSVQIPLLPQTYLDMPEHIDFILRNFPAVKEIWLQLVEPVEGEESGISVIELEKVLSLSLGKCREAGVKLGFPPGGGPAPCLFENAEAILHMIEMPPVEEDMTYRALRRVDLCEDCLLSRFCPGVHVQLARTLEQVALKKPAPGVVRLVLRQWPDKSRDPSVSWKTIGNESRFVLTNVKNDAGNKYIEEALIRVNYNCNHRCLFCWVESGFENPPHEEVVARIEELADCEVEMATITGGEPTLNRHLPEYISLLRRPNIKQVVLQTNAMLLHKEEAVAHLVGAGLDYSLVSLHSHDPEISDMLTGIDGAFKGTVQGIRNLQKHDVAVVLSHVINNFNYRTLPDFVKFVHSELNGTPIAFLNAAPIYGAMMHRGLIPRLTEVKVYLVRALKLCLQLHVPFTGLATMCGVPPCILDGNPLFLPDLRRVPASVSAADMIKTETCGSCALNPYCFGLRRHYAEIYGTDELHAVHPEGFKPPRTDLGIGSFMKKFHDAKSR